MMPARFRDLERHELSDIWSIDRSERIERLYRHENGTLKLEDHFIELIGWPPGAREQSEGGLLDCFDHGGVFIGAFVEERLVGVSVLDTRGVGGLQHRLQLKFLQVDCEFRGKGMGKRLFDLSLGRARELNARSLYISSAPTDKTVDFYLNLGCRLTEDVDPTLFTFEPEDIHLELPFI